MPPIHRVVFVVLETMIMAFPVAMILNAAFHWQGAAADAIAKGLLQPFFLGLVGMIIWIIRFLRTEIAYSRVGLASLLAIFIFFWTALPTVVE